MRPLIVLLIVIAAVVTYFVAFNSPGTDAPAPVGIGPGAVETVQPSNEPKEEVELAGLEGGDRTEVEAVVPQDTRIAPAASQSNELTGLVVDPDNNPVEDARVVLTRFGRNNLFFVNDDRQDRSGDRTTKTNSKGEYSFRNIVPLNDYSLKVHHPDFAHHEVGNVQVGESGQFEEPRIVLREGISLSGYIRDGNGAGVAEAKVFLTLNGFGEVSEDNPDTIASTTDGTGLYEFKNVGIGQWTLAVVAEGFGRVNVPQVSVTGEVNVTRDLTLEVARMIGGRMIASGGEPVVGATIQAFSLNQRSQQTRSTTKTIENGEFYFEDVPEGSYTLLANVPGYEPWRKQRVESEEMGVLIELISLPTVSGIVRDAGDGSPLTKFTVRLRQEVPNAPVPLPVQNTRVKVEDAEGAFTIPVPKAGNYVVEAVAESYAMCFSSSITIAAGQDLPGVIVNMTRGGKITGQVLDASGAPVRNAKVTSRDKDWSDDEFTLALGDMMPTMAVERTVRTDKQGRFEIEGLTPAEYKLDIAHPRHPAELKTGVFVTEGKTFDAGTINLRKGGSVTGVVRDPSGQMVTGAVVTVQTSPGGLIATPRSYRGKTDSEGRYEIGNISAGTYTVSVRRTAQSGVNPFQDWQDTKSSQKQITIVEGEQLDGVDFALGEAPQ